jgi:hypothetical protein
MGQIDRSKTSVPNYQSALRNTPEERRSNKSFGNITQFKYTLGLDSNIPHEEVNRRLSSENACTHQLKVLSSCLPSQNVSLKALKAVLLIAFMDRIKQHKEMFHNFNLCQIIIG